MDPREFRLGNLIHDKFFQIESPVDLSILGRLHDSEKAKDRYEPILLTKEWFIKLGYEVEQYENETIYEDWWSDWIDDGKKIYPKPYYFADAFELPEGIKYVHQLQNICFALTGRELEIKEIDKAEK